MKASIARVVTLLLLVAASFLAGTVFLSLDLMPVAVEIEELPRPEPVVNRYYLGTPKEYFQTDVEALITLHATSDVTRMRQDLIGVLWGEPGLPTTMPVVEASDTHAFLPAPEPSVARVEQLLVEMDYGLTSRVYHLIPTQPNGSAVLFHMGHSDDWMENLHHYRTFAEQGYAVVVLAMPLLAGNSQPVVDLPRAGRLEIIHHDHMKYLIPEHGHPVRYFLDPVVITLNYLQQNYEYRAYNMTGISGGGWTTTLAAAIDTRIKASAPVAGSFPIYLRSGIDDDWGDYEQNVPEVYLVANYLEMYVMGSTGKGRRQLQVLNQYDPCCFATTKSETYDHVVRDRVAGLDSGEYDLFLDSSHGHHIISDQAMTRILDWFSGAYRRYRESPQLAGSN